MNYRLPVYDWVAKRPPQIGQTLYRCESMAFGFYTLHFEVMAMSKGGAYFYVQQIVGGLPTAKPRRCSAKSKHPYVYDTHDDARWDYADRMLWLYGQEIVRQRKAKGRFLSVMQEMCVTHAEWEPLLSETRTHAMLIDIGLEA